MKKINIVAWHNGGGLSRDVDTLVSALPPDRFEVTLNGVALEQAQRHRQRIGHRAANAARLWLGGAAFGPEIYDVNLFLEEPVTGFYRRARVNAFIPNPEWFRSYQRLFLRGIDLVLCKTRSAQEAFAALGAETRYLGFTSDDRLYRRRHDTGDEGFLHVAGRSWQKGTGPLLDLWQRRPDWPLLTVVQNPRTYGRSAVTAVAAPNVRHILASVDDATLRALQNANPVHLCPSEVEGFGHCIVEAMSCGALTLTTDGPPMNELITPERGVLVACRSTGRQRQATCYFVDPADLERKVEGILAMGRGEREALGRAARQWFEDNDRLFRRRLAEVLEAC